MASACEKLGAGSSGPEPKCPASGRVFDSFSGSTLPGFGIPAALLPSLLLSTTGEDTPSLVGLTMAQMDPYLRTPMERPRLTKAPRKPASKAPEIVPRTAAKEIDKVRKTTLHTPSPNLLLVEKLEPLRRKLDVDQAGRELALGSALWQATPTTSPMPRPMVTFPMLRTLLSHVIYDDEDPHSVEDGDEASDLEM